jgi:hypothetical protein
MLLTSRAICIPLAPLHEGSHLERLAYSRRGAFIELVLCLEALGRWDSWLVVVGSGTRRLARCSTKISTDMLSDVARIGHGHGHVDNG